MIRLTKTFSDGRPTLSAVAPEYIIRSCFDFCTDKVKIRLIRFLKSKRKSITFDFKDEKVILTKE